MTDSLLGSQVAGYRIERVLGRGGMASVYFAWDTYHHRPVALKVMDERYRDTPSYVGRFIQEAQTIASWDQPNIVKVWDAGEENGIYYYAMEYIRGLDLAQLLRQYLDAGQLLPYTDVVRLGWAVATALDFAHSRGIIHRDVKPSNVLISVDGRVLLSDFGLVMDIHRGTMGETFGSPSYIAPEQARSSAQAVPQSDLYSLGIMLYEMLTGAVPFHDASPAALALKHLSEEPPRPRVLNPRLNPAVEAVLLRALRKRPDERYPTGREMMTALERAFGQELQGGEAAVPLPVSPGTVPIQAIREPLPSAADYRPVTELRGAAVPPPGGPPAPSFSDGAISGPPPASWTGAGRSNPRWWAWGCLAGLLAMGLLAVVLGAALAANRPGGPLFDFPWPALLPVGQLDPQATGTAQATAAIPPTLTVTATRLTPTLKPSATRTPQPTLTRTSTPTVTPAPTKANTPTRTASPTLVGPPTQAPTQASTPTRTPVPVYNLLLARQKNDGLILANTDQAVMPLASIEFWSRGELQISGEDWGLQQLEPGQCVLVWAIGGEPGLPKDVRCQAAGNLLYTDPQSRVLNRSIEVRFNDQRVATCDTGETRCKFDTRP